MGPRPFSRGNSPIGQALIALLLSLQWGRGLSAAEMTRPTPIGRDGERLQWGRGLSAAEIPTV